MCAHWRGRNLSVFLGRFAAFSNFCRRLLLARHARRFERLAAACLGNDAFVLHTTGEPPQHRLETFALAISYVYQLKTFLLWSNPIQTISIGNSLR